MRIAFVGYGGCGKSYFSQIFYGLVEKDKFTYINIDNYVKEMYSKKDTYDFLYSIFGPKVFYPNNFPNTRYLTYIFSKNKNMLEYVEQYFVRKLVSELDFNKDYIFDGIQCYKYREELNIDTIIYIKSTKKKRFSRLRSKLWSHHKIKLIHKLQRNYKFKKYDILINN